MAGQATRRLSRLVKPVLLSDPIGGHVGRSLSHPAINYSGGLERSRLNHSRCVLADMIAPFSPPEHKRALDSRTTALDRSFNLSKMNPALLSKGLLQGARVHHSDFRSSGNDQKRPQEGGR